MLWNFSSLVQTISLTVIGNVDKRLIKNEVLSCCFFGKRFLEKWDNKYFFHPFFAVVGNIRLLDVRHFYFFLLSAPFRHFQNSGHRQYPVSLVLIAIASSVLSAQVMASFGSVKTFRLHALVSLIPVVQSSSSQPASHLKHLLGSQVNEEEEIPCMPHSNLNDIWEEDVWWSWAQQSFL